MLRCPLQRRFLAIACDRALALWGDRLPMVDLLPVRFTVDLGKPMGLRLVFRTIVLALWFCQSVPGMIESVRAEGNDRPVQESSLSIKPSYFDQDPRANIKLRDDGIQHDALDFLVKSSLPGNLTGESQVAFSSFDSQTDKLYHEQKNRLLRFRLASDMGSFGYGAEYRSVGQGFRRPPGSNWRLDQEGTETWASQAVGPLRLKALFANFWDNVEQDPRRPRTTKTLGGTALGITLPGGSVLNFSYQRGTSETVGGPSKQAPQESWIEDMGASLYFYGGPIWDLTVSSSYSPSVNKLDPSKKATSYYHAIAGSYRPTESITIMPSLSFSEERYSWQGLRTATPTAMISFSYAPPSRNLSLTTYGFYSRSKSSDGWYDVQTVNLINSLLIPFGKAKKQAIAFELVYNQYLDAVYRYGSSEELLGRILYKVAAF